jgi:hypothetical protein
VLGCAGVLTAVSIVDVWGCWCAACRIYRCGELGCAGVLTAVSTVDVLGVLVCCLQDLQVWCVGVCRCADFSIYS